VSSSPATKAATLLRSQLPAFLVFSQCRSRLLSLLKRMLDSVLRHLPQDGHAESRCIPFAVVPDVGVVPDEWFDGPEYCLRLGGCQLVLKAMRKLVANLR
jgi:hypothetical protein